MKTKLLKKSLLSLLAIGLLAVNIMLPAKSTPHKEQPQAIIAFFANGGKLEKIGEAFGGGIIAGVTAVADLAPAFEAAAAGAGMAEVVGIVGGIIGAAFGWGAVIAVAA